VQVTKKRNVLVNVRDKCRVGSAAFRKNRSFGLAERIESICEILVQQITTNVLLHDAALSLKTTFGWRLCIRKNVRFLQNLVFARLHNFSSSMCKRDCRVTGGSLKILDRLFPP